MCRCKSLLHHKCWKSPDTDINGLDGAAGTEELDTDENMENFLIPNNNSSINSPGRQGIQKPERVSRPGVEDIGEGNPDNIKR